MNHDLTIQKIASNPIIAYSFNLPNPEVLQLSQYEQKAYPAILGNVLGMSVEKVRPMYRMGRVMSFDITPRDTSDPILVFSPIGNLSMYYRVWKDVMLNGFSWFRMRSRNDIIGRYDNSIFTFVSSCQGTNIEIPELVFAVIEMLKFKNDVIMNRNFE
jgi:hypothetical protein